MEGMISKENRKKLKRKLEHKKTRKQYEQGKKILAYLPLKVQDQDTFLGLPELFDESLYPITTTKI